MFSFIYIDKGLSQVGIRVELPKQSQKGEKPRAGIFFPSEGMIYAKIIKFLVYPQLSGAQGKFLHAH